MSAVKKFVLEALKTISSLLNEVDRLEKELNHLKEEIKKSR